MFFSYTKKKRFAEPGFRSKYAIIQKTLEQLQLIFPIPFNQILFSAIRFRSSSPHCKLLAVLDAISALKQRWHRRRVHISQQKRGFSVWWARQTWETRAMHAGATRDWCCGGTVSGRGPSTVTIVRGFFFERARAFKGVCIRGTCWWWRRVLRWRRWWGEKSEFRVGSSIPVFEFSSYW